LLSRSPEDNRNGGRPAVLDGVADRLFQLGLKQVQFPLRRHEQGTATVIQKLPDQALFTLAD
jgi:hypothetical protein